jgi:hypothetical protein
MEPDLPEEDDGSLLKNLSKLRAEVNEHISMINEKINAFENLI